MAYLATLLAMVALWGAWLLHRKRLESASGSSGRRCCGIAFPFLCNFAGWILTEAGRQPWVVYGLLKTSDAVSPTSSTLMVGGSLAVFMALYAGLGVADFVLMRRYARLDPPEIDDDERRGGGAPAPSY